MGQLINKVQFQVQRRSNDFLTYAVRVITGGWLGMVIAHIFQSLFGFQNFLFIFMIVITTAAVVRISRNWGLFSVMIFNLFCILVGMLLRMYIMVAPGA